MAAAPTLFDSLLAAPLATDPAAPLLTHYDAAEDSRIELSAVTTANWAAKIAGLLRDGLGTAPGDAVACDLSPHWLSVTIACGVWWSGCQLTLVDDPANAPGATDDPVATICTADRVDAHADADPLYVAGLDAFAMAPLDLPPGVDSLVAEARIYPDSFAPSVGADRPLGWASVDDVIKQGPHDLGGRVLAAGEPDTRGLVEQTLRVWTAGGSLVLATGMAQRFGDDSAARSAWLDRIRVAEKITAEV